MPADSIPDKLDGPYRKFSFEVELVDDLPSGKNKKKIGGFDKISGLTTQMETVEYREGGVNDHVHRLPGQYRHANLLLENGIVNEKVLFAWTNDLRKGSDPPEEARCNVEIRVRSGHREKDRWGFEVFDAYPVQWDGPELRANEEQGKPAMQTLELAHNGFTNLSGTPS